MPSPIGHAAAGLIVALATERSRGEAASTNPRTHEPANPRTLAWTFFVVCACLAALPDIDYIYPPIHRGPTHSIGATIIVMLVTAGVTWWSTGRIRWRLTLICGLAYFSHIVMDWLGEDLTLTPGVKAFWPISDRLFMSGWDVFRSTKRLDLFAPAQIAHNFRTFVQEFVLLGPILFWLLWRRSRVPPPSRQ